MLSKWLPITIAFSSPVVSQRPAVITGSINVEVDGGATVHTAGPALSPPLYLKLQRTGDQITASVRKTTTDPWTVIGSQTLVNLAATVYVGQAVTSHQQGVLANAQFRDWQLTLPAGQSSLPPCSYRVTPARPGP